MLCIMCEVTSQLGEAGRVQTVRSLGDALADGRTDTFLFTAASRDISLFEIVQTGSESHPATCSQKTGGKTIGGVE